MFWQLIYGVVLAFATGRFFADGRPSSLDSSHYSGPPENVSLSLSHFGFSKNASLSVIDIPVDAPRPGCWIEFMENSIKEFKEYLRRRTATPDATIPEDLPPDFGWSLEDGKSGVLSTDTLDFLQFHLKENVRDHNERFTAWDITWPRRLTRTSDRIPDDERTDYRSTIDVSIGFLCIQNDRQGGMSPEWGLSKLAWWMWRATLQCKYGADWVNYVTELQYLYYETVTDERARSVIEWAIRRKVEPQGVEVFPRPRPGETGEAAGAFWAILGGHYGIEFIKLLKDNKRALDEKTILEVGVVYDNRGRQSQYSVWIQIGDAMWIEDESSGSED